MSKNNKKSDEKTMQDYRDRQTRINKGAKVVALILVASMIVFYVISAGAFLWD